MTLVAVESDATDLSARMVVSCALPLVGPTLARVLGLPLARSTVQASLRAIKRHCESGCVAR